MKTMKLYNPKPTSIDNAPEKMCDELRELHGSLNAYNEKMFNLINQPVHIEIVRRLLEEVDVELDIPVMTFSGNEVAPHIEIPTKAIPLTRIDVAAQSDEDGVIYLMVNIDRMAHVDKRITNSLLTHELTHVWQMRRGDLHIDGKNGTITWKDTVYTTDNINAMVTDASGEFSIEKYYRQPWEEEAVLAEIGSDRELMLEISPDRKIYQAVWDRCR